MPKIYLLLGVSLLAAGIVIGLTNSPGGEFHQTGIASWYGPNFQGKTTANGEVFDMNELTAAHKSLPFGTRVKVVDLSSGNEVAVRINDRGPFVNERIIDLSRRAAEKLGIIDSGTAKVGLKIVEWGDKN